jgi:beta-glucosidase
MRYLFCFITLFAILGSAVAQTPVPDYRNPTLPIEQRVADLLKRMTLEEKVGQLALAARRGSFRVLDTTGKFNDTTALQAFRQMFGPDSKISPRDAAILRNAVQRYLREKTPLGIPALFQGEALHGFMENGSTSFPQALGLASTWDTDLVRQAFTAIADEMASAGDNQAFTPVINLARDPRWGRTEETYGEDPYVSARMGVAAIEGLQGQNFMIDRHHVLATPKHFAAYGQSEGGRNLAPANYSERVLREVFFEAFRAAVVEAQAGSIMAAYNEIDGVPCHVNGWLLNRVLRQEWGFQGYVTSDGGGLQMLVNLHHVAANHADAARMALAAGVDYDLSDGSVYNTLIAQVREGRIPESEVDKAAGRVLAAKFRLGLFENPYVDPDYAERITSSPEHQKLALKAAQEAIVLLKNDGNLLPLDLKKVKTIAVIGPNAADVHLGGYSREPAHSVSILEGIRTRVGPEVKVLYAEGCKITAGLQGWRAWYADKVEVPDAQSQVESIRAATEVARKAEVAIVVVGENESTNREAWEETHLGDRDSLDLIGFQNQLVQAIAETGTPTVVFLINGRPLSINYTAAHVPAILEGWYLGEEGGTAAANVLFGDVNPGGKLPVTFPRSVGQLPAYYNHKPSLERSYLLTNSKPLFPFGYGLSYATFRFENLRVEPAVIGTGRTATVSVDVSNTGNREGDEVPQLYIHERVSPVTQPVMQLKGFRRISLKPGEKKTVQFKLTPDMLSILDLDMHRVVEPGVFDIMVGPSSAETTSVPLEVVEK